MREIKIVLRGPPLSTNSVYKHARGISYMTKKGRELKNSYIQQVKEQYKRPPVTKDLEATIYLFFGDKRKRDWDNAHKLSMDSMNKLVWDDDSQIQKATVYKGYDKDKPRMEIIVKEFI